MKKIYCMFNHIHSCFAFLYLPYSTSQLNKPRMVWQMMTVWLMCACHGGAHLLPGGLMCVSWVEKWCSSWCCCAKTLNFHRAEGMASTRAKEYKWRCWWNAGKKCIVIICKTFVVAMAAPCKWTAWRSIKHEKKWVKMVKTVFRFYL